MIRRVSYFIFMLLFAGYISAQEAGVRTLGFDEYLDLLKSESLILKQSGNQTRSTTQDRLSTRAALLPRVGFDMNYQRDFTQNFLFLNDDSGFLPEKFRTNFNNNIDANFGAEQVLFDREAHFNYQVSKLAEEHAQIAHKDLSMDLVNQGAKLFWQTVFAREAIGTLTENRDLAEAQWKQMQDLFEKGMISKLQLRQSELYYRQTLPQLQSASNTYVSLLNELMALANLPLEAPLELNGNLDASENTIEPALVGDSIPAANTSIQKLKVQREMAMQNIRARKAARNPVLRLRLGYNFNAQSNEFDFENDNRLAFGQLSLQVPLFTGGYNSAQIQKARIERQNAELEIQNQRQLLKKDLQNAKLLLQNAELKITAQKEAVSLAETELEIAGESLKLGTITPLENREIRIALTQARLGLIQAHLEWRIAKLQIERILGKN